MAAQLPTAVNMPLVSFSLSAAQTAHHPQDTRPCHVDLGVPLFAKLIWQHARTHVGRHHYLCHGLSDEDIPTDIATSATVHPPSASVLKTSRMQARQPFLHDVFYNWLGHG